MTAPPPSRPRARRRPESSGPHVGSGPLGAEALGALEDGGRIDLARTTSASAGRGPAPRAARRRSSMVGASGSTVAMRRKRKARSNSSRRVTASLAAAPHVDVPVGGLGAGCPRGARSGPARRRPTWRPTRPGRGTRRRCRPPAPGSRGSTRGPRRTSRSHRPRRRRPPLRRSSCTTRSPTTHWPRSLSGVQMMHLLDPLVGRGDHRGGGHGVVGLELDHGEHGDAQGDRAPPRAGGTGPAGRAACPRWSCSPATGRCGTTRSRGRWPPRRGWRPPRAAAAPCPARPGWRPPPGPPWSRATAGRSGSGTARRCRRRGAPSWRIPHRGTNPASLGEPERARERRDPNRVRRVRASSGPRVAPGAG